MNKMRKTSEFLAVNKSTQAGVISPKGRIAINLSKN